MPSSSTLNALALCFAAIAVILGPQGIISCHTFKFPSTLGNNTYIEAGFFSYETVGFVAESDTNTIWIVDYCRPYTDIEDDLKFDYETDKLSKSLQRIAITIPVLGVVALIASCVFFCVPVSDLVYKFVALIYLTTCILQGISLKVVESDLSLNNPFLQYLNDESPSIFRTLTDKCEWGTGYKLSITATVFWGVAAILSWMMPPPEKDDVPIPAGVPEEEKKVVQEEAMEEQAPPVESKE
jgi:hypothetical protein